VDQSHFEPVKIVIERRGRPGAKPQFGQWTRSFMMTASRFRDSKSRVCSISVRPAIISLRFASLARRILKTGGTRQKFVLFVKQADAASTATDRHQVRTGLETWFALPSRSIAPAVPPRWKMALVTWLALFPQVVLLSLLIPSALPMLIRVALLTAVPVAMLTWLVMPRLSGLLHAWLYAARTV
jgi:antibiotic biosynthesis monooxygenase (ABM) superfamily enzyme